MSISALFSTPYYTGAGTTTDVPGLFPVALNGRPYIVDLKSGEFRRESIKILRAQANVTNLPDESSLNPEDLWRRSQMTWHRGAGQRYLDREESDPARFWKSEGADVWDKWELTCLPLSQGGDDRTGSVSTLLATSTKLYWTVDNVIKYATTLGGAFSAHTAAAGQNYTDSTSDGYYVYFAKGSDGIYLTNRTVGTAAVSWITGTISLVRFVRGRLMAAGGASIYNILTAPSTAGPTAAPAALKTMANADWRWVDFAEGVNQIYMAGYSGDKSWIYRTAVKADGSALDEPVAAGQLPDGEVINCMSGYLGYLIIGTSLGLRFASASENGDLTIGPLLNTGRISVTHLEPQDRFVYFAWPDDGEFGGIGRIDLSQFVAPLAPAFATDQASTQANFLCGGLVTFLGELNWVSKAGAGSVVCEHSYVDSDTLGDAWLETGELAYGVPDEKVGMWVDVRTEPLPANCSYEVSISVDDAEYETLGIHDSTDSVGMNFPIAQRVGRKFKIRLDLYSNSVDGSTAPTVNRLTLRSYAAPNRAEVWTLPLLLHETVLANGGVPYPLEVLNELNRIRGMVTAKQLVTYQEGSETHAVFVEDFQWVPHHPTKDETFWQGTCTVVLKETST